MVPQLRTSRPYEHIPCTVSTLILAVIPLRIVVVTMTWLCPNGSSRLSRFQYAPLANSSPERHRTPRGRTTAPHLPHTAAQSVIGERTGPNAKLVERGASKGVLPGTACLVTGKGADLRGGKGLHHFWRRSFPGFLFVTPDRDFNFMGGIFFPGWAMISPPRIFFRVPGYFGATVERPTPCP